MHKPKSSALSRVMQKGHRKVNFAPKKAHLLMTFSEQDHKRIANLIKQWLNEEK